MERIVGIIVCLFCAQISPQYDDHDIALQNVREELVATVSSLRVIFDREAMLSLNSFMQHVLQRYSVNFIVFANIFLKRNNILITYHIKLSYGLLGVWDLALWF